MRLLALCDRPPRPDPGAVLAQRPVDAVMCLGDLQPAWIEGLRGAEVPKLGVYGNHDEEPYMPDFGIEDLHLRTRTVGGVSFCGFEGCVRYAPDGGRQYTEAEAERMVLRLPPADVLLAHCPPWGVNDDPGDPAHLGWRALLGWVEEHEPRWLLHGHTHPRPGARVKRVGATRVEYVSGSKLIDLDVV